MTIQEASEGYQIPMEVLRAYEGWDLRREAQKAGGAWQYDDTDLERLSTVLTLRDLGFTLAEAEVYLRLLLEGEVSRRERLGMLDRRRSAALDEIHIRERQLERLDYLRHQLRQRPPQTGGTAL